jgi:hypothetical protein
MRIKGQVWGNKRIEIRAGILTAIEYQACTKCNKTKAKHEFLLRKNTIKTYSWCKDCMKENTHDWRMNRGGKLKEKERNLKRYGLTMKDYQSMLTSQNHVCAICHNPETFKSRNHTIAQLAVDHCHQTGKIRALLCRRCNQLLGQVNDDVHMFQVCIDYLNRYK